MIARHDPQTALATGEAMTDTSWSGMYPSGRPFLKMHGLRNHFVIVDARDEAFRPDPSTIVRLCDPEVGVCAP